MQRLEKAIFAADARVKIRWDHGNKSRILMGVAFAAPFLTYWIHGTCAPSGYLNNYRASAGMYMNWL